MKIKNYRIDLKHFRDTVYNKALAKLIKKCRKKIFLKVLTDIIKNV